MCCACLHCGGGPVCRLPPSPLPPANTSLLHQEITRDSLNADNQSAFWHNRYTLRFAYDAMVPPAEPPPPATAAGAGSGGTTTAAPAVAAPSVSRPTPQLPHDVPAFLQRHKQHILDTGKYLNVMRQCKAEPPRTLPVGTRLGECIGGGALRWKSCDGAAVQDAYMSWCRQASYGCSTCQRVILPSLHCLTCCCRV